MAEKQCRAQEFAEGGLKIIYKKSIKNFKYPIKSTFSYASKNKGFDESKGGY